MLSAAMPLSFGQTSDPFFDELRATEYSRLDADDQAYLDYTGSALYARRQIRAHAARLEKNVLGNPHSENGPSLISTAIINDAKARLLRFLDAPDDEYVVTFTANTSAAIRLVAESYPFGPDASLVLAADNHNSMNGIREFALRKGAAVDYAGLDESLRLTGVKSLLHRSRTSEGGLFGFPAQSNFSGLKHPLALIDEAHRLGYAVLLDAAAYLPTNSFSLRRHRVDFVALSVYKITGYPTGVGALVARKESLSRLKRPWFAGGTVDYASVQNRTHKLIEKNGEGFEDGTPAFIDIAAVADGLALLDEIGMDRITSHVTTLRALFVSELNRLRSTSGRSLARVYGPSSWREAGATVAFNLFDRTGLPIPFARVVERARNEGVSLRGGCFCNPGASEAAFGFPPDTARRCLSEAAAEGFSIERFSECLGADTAVGGVRASMGIPTNQRDIQRAISVLSTFA